MPFAPWAERPVQGTLAGEQPAKKPNWLQDIISNWTMPWQPEHWTNPQPEWTRTVGKAGLGAGLLAGGALLGGYGIPAAASWLSGLAPGLTGAALPFVSHPTALGLLGGGAGLLGSSVMAPAELGQPTKAKAPAVTPTTPTPTTPAPTLPQPGETGGAGWGQPYLITDPASGRQGWFNPNTGEFAPITPPTTPVEPYDPIVDYYDSTTGEVMKIPASEAQHRRQMEVIRAQYGLEQQGMESQLKLQRQTQEAGAAQSMAQMYAADPYKYWAQMGQGTPGAVARLTGGQVAPGGQMGQVPLSTPSAQWWGNLLPGEQQQIAGGLNWLGVNPEDWFSVYQRMIPGLGQRQVEPQWSR